VLAGRIAEKAGRLTDAIALYTDAVAFEDRLSYAEPADWFYPTRHFLGAALLDAKRPREAEAIYRRDLEKHPGNGWALFGLWKSLEAQHKADAPLARAAFEAAWSRADTKLARSAF
jgi:tetratricopeptide (TPR) repeat protein